jgi:hypothetical protein
MQARTLLIWIVIAGFLGAIVVLTRQARPQGGSDTTVSWRSLGIDPARVLSVTRIVEGQPNQIVERAGAGGEGWIVRWGSSEQQQSWPADARRIRSGNRSLSTQRISEADEASLDEISGSITVTDTDGREMDIAFGTTAIGGYIPIRVDERNDTGIVQSRWYGRIQTDVQNAFVMTGFLPWRSESIFSGAASQVDGASLTAGAHHVELLRDPQGWAINEPFMVRADSADANKLVGSLMGISAAGFVDIVDDGILAGFESPIATVSLRSGEDTTTMWIGSQADISGQQLYARIESPSGNAIVRVLNEDLAELTPTPEAYISGIPVSVSVSDIARLQILGSDQRARLNAKRELGLWQIDGTTSTVQYGEALDRLVQVLSSDPAAGTQYVDPDQVPPEMTGSILGYDHQGEILFEMQFGLDSSEDGLRLLLAKELDNAGKIIWIATSDKAGGTGAWLTAMAGRRIP